MFASIDLALRIDTASARLSRSIALSLPRAGSPKGPFALPLGSGFAVFGKRGSPINKVIGCGIDREIDEAELGRIEAAFREREERVRIEVSTLARAEAGERLTARGYRLQGFENVLGLDLKQRPQETLKQTLKPVTGSVTVTAVTDASLESWLSALVDGFVEPDHSGVPGEVYPREIIEESSRDFARTADIQRYLAHIDGIPAGSASMRLDGGIAEMCGAATRPAFRRRGVQQALFQRRIDDARAAGCEVAVVTTAPGTQSQANAERRGFRLLYARAALVLGAEAAAPVQAG